MAINTGSAARIFRLLVGLSIVVAGVSIVLTLFYLWLSGAPMRPAVVPVAIFGGLTVLVAGGLMALIYTSAQSGHDSRAAGPTPRKG